MNFPSSQFHTFGSATANVEFVIEVIKYAAVIVQH